MDLEYEFLKDLSTNIDIDELNTNNCNNEYQFILEKYPFLSVFPINTCSKCNYIVKKGHIKQIANNFQYIEITLKNARKYYLQHNNTQELDNNMFLVIQIEDDTELCIVTDFLCESHYSKSCIERKCDKIEFVRKATESDLNFFNQKYIDESVAKKLVVEQITKFQLDMKIINTLWQSDRQRLTILFTAPQRVDFRELVKDLAKIFKTRIELRQISSRDEAKLLGAFVGPCGRDMCCSSFLNHFEHVTVEHAKIQQLSYNLTKLTGNCGRLKCCLKYEYELYQQIYDKIVPVGTIIYLNEQAIKVKKLDIPNQIASITNETLNQNSNITFDELKEYIEAGKVVKPYLFSEQQINKEEMAKLSSIED